MRKSIILGGLAAFLLAWGCQQEDDLQPSYIDKDWMVVEDDPNNPLTHLRYTIYTDYGVPVFVNDTLGSEIRHDRYGEPYVHYELLRMGYNLTTSSSHYYVLADDTADMMAALEVMQEYLFDILPEDRRPVSYMLVDSLQIGKDMPFDSYYKYLRTTCVSNIERFKTMSDSAKQSTMAELAGLEYVTELIESADTNLVHQFDSVGHDVRLDTRVYLPNMWRAQYAVKQSTSAAREVPRPETFGFLAYRDRQLNAIYWPTRDQNWAGFVGMVLTKTEEEVRAQYEQDTCVIQRYELMRQIMQNAGIIEGGEETTDPAPEE